MHGVIKDTTKKEAIKSHESNKPEIFIVIVFDMKSNRLEQKAFKTTSPHGANGRRGVTCQFVKRKQLNF